MDVASRISPTLAVPSVEEVARKYGSRIRAVAYRLVGNLHDAEDVTQAVLLKVVLCLRTYRREASIASWLHAVTVHTARDFLRRTTRSVPSADPELLANVPSAPRGIPLNPEAHALSLEARAQFDRAVAGLPELYRDAYMLADLEGLPHEEVGARLGVPPATVKTRAFRARLMLRCVLAPYFDGSTA